MIWQKVVQGSELDGLKKGEANDLFRVSSIVYSPLLLCHSHVVQHHIFLLVGVVARHDRLRRFTVAQVGGLVGHPGRNVEKIPGLVDDGFLQTLAVGRFDPPLKNVNCGFVVSVEVGLCRGSGGNDHQIHRNAVGARCGPRNAHKVGQLLQRCGVVLGPNGDNFGIGGGEIG